MVGAYDARQREISGRLDTERRWARNLSTRLSVLNRVLRHDFRTNVTIIKGHANHILRGEKDAESAAEVIIDQAKDLHELSEEARRVESHLSGTRRRQPMDVAAELREIVADIEETYPDAEIEARLPDHAVALASPMLDEALEHLVRNAIEHNSERPSVSVEVSNGEGGITLRVVDDGPGIPPTELEVLARGRETAMQHTSGLGLWIAKWVVEASGGTLDLQAREPSGTKVSVHLPTRFP